MTVGYGPSWLRRRSAGQCKQSQQMSVEFIKDLNLELVLEGHSSCVNCLEWNQRGTLLASGSDDRNVIIWNPFTQKKKIVTTEHQDNIFSVKFIQDFGDTLIATCGGDGQVLLTDIISGRTMMSCRECHTNRLKRLVTHPNQPCLIWSACEGGYITQYDTREKHRCTYASESNLIIDLRSESLAAKCLAINPLRDEVLAVGTDHAQIQLYDRRRPQNATARFIPGHLARQKNKTFGASYIAFNQTGSELLANLNSEQIYLFDTVEPSESFKSFEANIKPLLLDASQPKSKLLQQIRPAEPMLDNNDNSLIDYTLREFKLELDQGRITIREYIEKLNAIISDIGKNLPDLYCLRAAALTKRGWRGDSWQALKDCCEAIANRPLDYWAIAQLAEIACNLKNLDIVRGTAEIIEIITEEFSDAKHLKPIARKLNAFISRESMSPDHEYDSKLNPLGQFNRQEPCDNMKLMDLLAKYNLRSQRPTKEYDFTKRFCGHCNMYTDIKEANFFGPNDEFIVAASDDGAAYIWEKKTSNLVKAMNSDAHILNCVQPHPSICMLATSGIEPNVKIWSASGKTCRDIVSLNSRCAQNQDFMSVDPLEAMIMMLYPDS